MPSAEGQKGRTKTKNTFYKGFKGLTRGFFKKRGPLSI
jgi:hypothetical protein